MKRSDMLTFMHQQFANSHCGGMSEMSDEERMDYLLTKLEEAGMLPPPTKVHDVFTRWEPELNKRQDTYKEEIPQEWVEKNE